MLSILLTLLFSTIVANGHVLTVKGTLKCGPFPAAAVSVKLWKNSQKSVIDETHSDKQGNFELTSDTIEHNFTPIIVIYHDCDDGVKVGQRKLKLQVPQHYVGSGHTFDVGIFNLETRIKHNEEREKHVDRRRRSGWESRSDESPDSRNDPW